MIMAPGEKVFGALLAIAGVGIVLTGHWATTDDMIADLIAGLLMLGIWRYDLTDVEFSALTATFGPSKRRTSASSSATSTGRRCGLRLLRGGAGPTGSDTCSPTTRSGA